MGPCDQSHQARTTFPIPLENELGTSIMKFQINRQHLIKEVQEEFNRTYPFLKIEFLKKTTTLPNEMAEEIEVSDSMKVVELEEQLEGRFGLSVQVYRKSGNLWIETRMTRHWTLGQQNEHGEDIASTF